MRWGSNAAALHLLQGSQAKSLRESGRRLAPLQGVRFTLAAHPRSAERRKKGSSGCQTQTALTAFPLWKKNRARFTLVAFRLSYA